MRRRFSFLLTLLMLCTMAFAQNIGQHGDEITDINHTYDKLQFFVISNKEGNYTCSVRPRYGATGEVTIPAEIEVKTHHKFKVIRAERFGSIAGGITKITFPEGLQEIFDECFSRSTALTEINIPASVTKIGEGVFSDCESLTNIDVSPDNQNFKFDTYNGQKMLLSKDGKDLYCYLATNQSDNTNNGYLTLPETVTHIHQSAITYNNNFTYLRIPKGVTTIDVPAIYHNGQHTTFTVEEGNTNFGADGGVLTDKDGKYILCVPFHMGKDVIISTDPEIKKRVFEINGNTGYTQVNENAFYYCEELNRVIIPEGIKILKDNAFSNCYSLEEVTFPVSLDSIEGNPFFRLNSIVAYHVKEGNSKFKDIDGVLVSSDSKKLIKYPLHRAYVTDTKNPDYGTVSYTIPSEIEEIGPSAFNEVSFKDIVIPNTIKKIDESAFNTCTKLQTVTFEPTCQLTEIAKTTFQNCLALRKIEIPASITKIGQGAFYRSGLETVDFDGNNIESIKNQAFANCDSLKNFNISTSCNLKSIGQEAFLNDKKLETFTLPQNVTSLGWSVFSGCKGLKSFTFAGNGVTTLSKWLFYNCEKLTSITLPESLKAIQEQAFAGCKSLGDLTIPAATTSVDHDSFRFCDSLNNIYVESGNTVYSSVDGMLCTGGTDHNEILYTMPPGRANSDYTLLPTIKTIGTEACFWNQNLTNIAIPSSVENIQDDAFYGCEKLKTVTCMGSTAPTLGANAFNYALTDDATLYYRKKDEATYKTWAGEGKFEYRHPSFNYYFNRADRQDPDSDLVEYIPLSDNAVAVVSNESVDPESEGSTEYKASDKTTLIIPAKVSDEFEGTTFNYDVKVVYDYAFNTNTSLRTLTFFGPISYIGVNAFHKGDQAAFSDGIYFVSDYPEKGILFAQDKYKLYNGDNQYKAFADNQKVYVKVSQFSKYKEALNTANHPCDVETNIPVSGTKNANAFGDYLTTFCRGFATTFPADSKIVPYATVANSYLNIGGKNYTALIKAQSLDDGNVPAWTGVILRNKNTNDDGSYNGDYSVAYYQIAEDEPTAIDETLVKGLYEDKFVYKQADGKTNYAMKNGTFYPLSKDGKMKAFRSYLSMQIPESGTLSRISISFDDGTTTEIDNISNDDAELDGAVYSLTGIKVADSWQKSNESLASGMYIVNGKKVVKK